MLACQQQNVYIVMTIGDRIKLARERKGMSQRGFAKKLGRSQQQLAHWEAGRIPKPHDLRKIAEMLNEPLAFLEFGEEAQEAYSFKVPIVGLVGAGGHINPIDDHAMGGGLDMIDAPPGAIVGTVGAIIRGTSFYPFLKDGATIFWSMRHETVSDYLHEMVVCHLYDGRKTIKMLTPGTQENRFTLTSPNAEPMLNQHVESVSPIDWMKPA